MRRIRRGGPAGAFGSLGGACGGLLLDYEILDDREFGREIWA
jgi:hypothetical protein